MTKLNEKRSNPIMFACQYRKKLFCVKMFKHLNAISRTTFLLMCVLSCMFIYGGYQHMAVDKLKADLASFDEAKYMKYNAYESDDGVESRIKSLAAGSQSADNIKCNIQSEVFQPSEAVDFPSFNATSPRIPHKIHQIYHSEVIPDLFQEAMLSFTVNNPTWEYWFWTLDSGRKLLQDKYPYLLDSFDRFGKDKAKKCDLLRYAIIHAFGGVYADLDVKNVRPLDKATMKYACIIPTEPFEHSSLFYNRTVLLSSAVLLCRPGHPFFTMVLINLQIARHDGSPVSTTGPLYITEIYMFYNNLTEPLLNEAKVDVSSNSPYFYKGTRTEDDADAVYIPNSQYFMDNIDPSLLKNDSIEKCQNLSLRKYNSNYTRILEQRGCNEYNCRRELRRNRKFAFTLHYWYHLWLKSKNHITTLRKVHVDEIIEKYNSYR